MFICFSLIVGCVRYGLTLFVICFVDLDLFTKGGCFVVGFWLVFGLRFSFCFLWLLID